MLPKVDLIMNESGYIYITSKAVFGVILHLLIYTYSFINFFHVIKLQHRIY